MQTSLVVPIVHFVLGTIISAAGLFHIYWSNNDSGFWTFLSGIGLVVIGWMIASVGVVWFLIRWAL